jgi:hypothetical protein
MAIFLCKDCMDNLAETRFTIEKILRINNWNSSGVGYQEKNWVLTRGLSVYGEKRPELYVVLYQNHAASNPWVSGQNLAERGFTTKIIIA